MNNFNDVINYLESFINLEKDNKLFNSRTYRLDRMKEILNVLGNPQNHYKIIHVAGSKGKGSVCAFISSGLVASGEKTGLYLSPHVCDYRERFQINNAFASDKEYTFSANFIKDKLKNSGLKPTAFEMFTAFAFQLFKDTNCTYAVVETGLGGRLDATNVVLPIASVITTIELEHTDILGNTIIEIATEKSKIIKPNTPVFTYEQEEDALKIISNEAKINGSKFYFLPDYVNALKKDLKDLDSYVNSLSLRGEFQKKNFLLSLLVLRYTDKLTDKTAYEVSKTSLIGRFEEVNFKDRVFILDGAHTENSVLGTVNTFITLNNASKTCIFGCVKGKNIKKMASIITKHFKNIIITTPGTWKKSDLDEIYYVFTDAINKSVNTYKSFKDKSSTPASDLLKNSNTKDNVNLVLLPNNKEALNSAISYTDKSEAILVCGSFYLIGDIKCLMT